MRVIARKILRQFWAQKQYADAARPLKAWHDEACPASWKTPQDIKNLYASASFVGNNRVVFNIGGNKYRLVVDVQYTAGRPRLGQVRPGGHPKLPHLWPPQIPPG